MKLFPLLAAAALTLAAAPAQAAEDRLFARFESATLDCLDYPSKVNCDKAAGASKTYMDMGEGMAKKECHASVTLIWMKTMSVQFLGPDRDGITQTLAIARKSCGIK
jgi:hypothetical protein